MDQRNQSRVVADRALTCRYRGAEHPIFVYNLSPEGCMALLQECKAGEGDQLAIDFPSHGYAEGRIIWREGSVLGIAFGRKLDATAIELMNAVPRPDF